MPEPFNLSCSCARSYENDTTLTRTRCPANIRWKQLDFAIPLSDRMTRRIIVYIQCKQRRGDGDYLTTHDPHCFTRFSYWSKHETGADNLNVPV